VLQRSNTDLNQLAEECLEEFKLLAKDRPFHLERLQGNCVASVDSEKVHQVITNLLDNAIKYSPEKNPIELKVAQPDPAKIRISVTDHGPGIPRDKQHLLFSRFFRVPSDATIRQSGLGLGLYLSRRLIDLHGGHIDVNSEPGKGTTFYFDLPKDAAA
jgi:signal transduction histidine kinase